MGRIKLLIPLVLCAVQFACGVYGFRGNNPPKGINSLAVPTFQDNSGFSAPTLADQFTQELKNRIINDNTFRVADKSVADGILNCTITNVRDEALVISEGENVAQRKVTITVTVDFQNLNTQKRVWEKNFENYGEYPSDNQSLSRRTEGINVAVSRITEDILIDLTSNW